jgi:hypothetical protein
VKVRIVLSTGPTMFPEDSVGRYSVEVVGLTEGAFGAHEFVFIDRTFLATEAGSPGQASLLAAHAYDHDQAGALAERQRARFPEVTAGCWYDESSWVRSSLEASDGAIGERRRASGVEDRRVQHEADLRRGRRPPERAGRGGVAAEHRHSVPA